jgi:penicillin amidase
VAGAARDRAWGIAIGAGFLTRSLFLPSPPHVSLASRLDSLPRDLPAARSVSIHSDAHQIPFIEADEDEDLAVALGVVHAHLRLAQMETMRLLALGRVSEWVGPLAVELDRALRLFGFARAVPAIIAGLSEETRRWAEGFVRGVNHVLAKGALPHELRLLDVRPEPWTLEHLFTVARLAAADVSWLIWARLLRARAVLTAEDWAALWPLLLEAEPTVSAPGEPEEAIAAFARSGSNAAAVSGWRSASGSALFCADPHLSVMLPNVWLAIAFRSRSYNVAGLMPAGLPVVAIGRNPWIAWGGTSLHAASSELFDVSGEALEERVEDLHVRGLGTRRLVMRESRLGPVVSDGMLLRDQRPLALRWIGHEPSDEMGALLAVMRADGAETFRAALAGFAVPGQNMLHAGSDGRVGHLLAARLPARPAVMPADIVAPPSAATAWDRLAGTPDLPHWIDPPEGFVASANDRPPEGDVPIGYFFSPSDRATRMRSLLNGAERLSLEDLARLQLDVIAPNVLRLRDALLVRFGSGWRGGRALRALAEWDGSYDAGSEGALVFEVVLGELFARARPPERRRAMAAVWVSRGLIAREVLGAPGGRMRRDLERSLRRAEAALRKWRNWGGMHRMRMRHNLSVLPLLGRRYVFADFPADGSNDTLNKTGHPTTARRHTVQYGASARFLADMADPDANHVVLLGGQDGVIGSETFMDQTQLWRASQYVQLPLRPETAHTWPHLTVLRPT